MRSLKKYANWIVSVITTTFYGRTYPLRMQGYFTLLKSFLPILLALSSSMFPHTTGDYSIRWDKKISRYKKKRANSTKWAQCPLSKAGSTRHGLKNKARLTSTKASNRNADDAPIFLSTINCKAFVATVWASLAAKNAFSFAQRIPFMLMLLFK